MGGFGRRLNLVPMINNLNQANFRYAIEQPIVDCVMKRNTIVWYRVTPEYANNTTLRPSSFEINYSIVKPSVTLSVVPWRVALGTLLSFVPRGSDFTMENHVGPVPQETVDTLNNHRNIIRALCR